MFKRQPIGWLQLSQNPQLRKFELMANGLLLLAPPNIFSKLKHPNVSEPKRIKGILRLLPKIALSLGQVHNLDNYPFNAKIFLKDISNCILAISAFELGEGEVLTFEPIEKSINNTVINMLKRLQVPIPDNIAFNIDKKDKTKKIGDQIFFPILIYNIGKVGGIGTKIFPAFRTQISLAYSNGSVFAFIHENKFHARAYVIDTKKRSGSTAFSGYIFENLPKDEIIEGFPDGRISGSIESAIFYDWHHLYYDMGEKPREDFIEHIKPLLYDFFDNDIMNKLTRHVKQELRNILQIAKNQIDNQQEFKFLKKRIKGIISKI